MMKSSPNLQLIKKYKKVLLLMVCMFFLSSTVLFIAMNMLSDNNSSALGFGCLALFLFTMSFYLVSKFTTKYPEIAEIKSSIVAISFIVSLVLGMLTGLNIKF